MRKYLFVFKKHRGKLVILAWLSVIASLVGIVSVYYSGRYIDIIVAATEVNTVLLICVILLIITSLSLLLAFIDACIRLTLNETFIYDFKSWAITRIRGISLIKYKNFDAAYLSKRIDEDSREIVHFFTDNYITVVIKFIELIVVSILIFSINFPIGILMFFLCPIYFFVYKIFRKLIFEKNLEAREKSAEFFKNYTYQLDCMEDLIIESEFDRDDSLLQGVFSLYYEKYKSFITVSAKLKLIQSFIIGLMQLLVFFIGGISVLRGNTTIGLLSTLMMYFSQVLGNISYYIEIAKKYQINKAAVCRMDEIFNISEEKDGNHKLEQIYSINANITFSIDKEIILENVNLDVERNEIIGIIGKNGSGKSTLIKLIMGALKATRNREFSIVFNKEHFISELDCVYLRNRTLSYIPQRILLKDSTVCEVLNEFCEYKTSEDFITDVISRNLSINEDICTLITTNWNKNVSQLSGGDRQLIAVLRGFTKENISILIMDEPTSNLDLPRIEWLKEALRQSKQDKIIFIVSHEHSIKEVFDKTIILN